MKPLVLLATAFVPLCLTAQADSSDAPVQFSVYVEPYLGYDFAGPDDHDRPDFLFSYDRHNEVTVNLGLLQAEYAAERVRASLGLMTGTYANANYAAEPDVLKNLFQANVGVRLSRSRDLWLDAGVLRSYLGFASALGKDNWTLTRALAAEGAPDYVSGVQVAYATPDGRWRVSGVVVNGWQRIRRPDGNDAPGGGHQVTFTPRDGVTVNSGSYVGGQGPDTARRMRYFHNFYARFGTWERFGLLVGFDVGAQQRSRGSSRYAAWYAPTLIARYAATDRSAIAAQVEYFDDRRGVIVATGTPSGFQTFGYSLNYDYAVSDALLWRVEARGFDSADRVFDDGGSPTDSNFLLTTALAIEF